MAMDMLTSPQSRDSSSRSATLSTRARVSSPPRKLATANTAPASVFLWEWFTTKPYVDSGEVRFIGSVESKWSRGVEPTNRSPVALVVVRSEHQGQRPRSRQLPRGAAAARARV